MIVQNFERVELPAQKALPCPTCGKKVRRQHTFGQTLNPFNKNDEGLIKTRAEILAELRAEIAAWLKLPVYCGRPCSDGDS